MHVADPHHSSLISRTEIKVECLLVVALALALLAVAVLDICGASALHAVALGLLNSVGVDSC
jgi:hypothetical protein